MTASSTDRPSPTPEPSEASRRKPGASGLPVVLADGRAWLLALPRFRPAGASLTEPDVDAEIDRLFERSALRGEIALADAWSAARTLLLENYDLSDDEFAELASLAPGEEARDFAAAVVEVLFGPRPPARTYTAWVRASLLANAVPPGSIGPADLGNVLATLVATGRAVPAPEFIDACRMAEEQAEWENVI